MFSIFLGLPPAVWFTRSFQSLFHLFLFLPIALHHLFYTPRTQHFSTPDNLLDALPPELPPIDIFCTPSSWPPDINFGHVQMSKISASHLWHRLSRQVSSPAVPRHNQSPKDAQPALVDENIFKIFHIFYFRWLSDRAGDWSGPA